MIALATLMLVASACGSDDSAVSGDGLPDNRSGLGEAASTSDGDLSTDDFGGDADESLVAGDTDDGATGDDAMDSSGAVEADAAAARQSNATTAPDDEVPDGGFFAPEPDEPMPAPEVRFRPFVDTDRDPISTFALDVDTGSYSLARRQVEAGRRPDPGSVRVEEFVNSFSYDYDAPRDGLGLQADAGPSPFEPDNVILRVGVQAERVANDERPPASLTFVVDTSGSMDRTDRLGLVKSSLSRLAAELESDDTVAIVTYSDASTVILDPTPARDLSSILEAIDELTPTGSTNLEAGLRTGYDLAGSTLEPGRINRVILASDGIANVGLADPAGLARMIREDADRGIQLVTVGVGMEGFNDELMEQLADRGDGFYAYVDDQAEAEILFGDELVSTLLTVAIDGKIQVEFDADTVERYRLIGFENRAVLDDDFRNDAVDAGELGAGHQVTALYELTLGSGFGPSDSLGVVRIRWEDPDDGSVDETSLALSADIVTDRWADTDADFRLAVTVAAWAELLRGSPYTGQVDLDQVRIEAEALSPGSGPVEEFARLVGASR